jgi:hypothetical protein
VGLWEIDGFGTGLAVLMFIQIDDEQASVDV